MSWVKGWRGTTGVHAALHSMGHERTSGSPLPAQGRWVRWWLKIRPRLLLQVILPPERAAWRPFHRVRAGARDSAAKTRRKCGGSAHGPARGNGPRGRRPLPAFISRSWEPCCPAVGTPPRFLGGALGDRPVGAPPGERILGSRVPSCGAELQRLSQTAPESQPPETVRPLWVGLFWRDGEPRGGGPGVRGLLSLRDALLTTPPPLSAPLFQLHHLPSGPDFPSPPPSLPPTLFSSQLHSSGKASGCSGGRMQLWWLCTTLLKVFTSMAQVPVGCRGALHPSKMGSTWCPLWAGSTGFQRNPWEIGVLFKVQGMFKSNHNTKVVTGTSLWSCGKASALSLHGARVPSLGRELRFCVPRAKRQISK